MANRPMIDAGGWGSQGGRELWMGGGSHCHQSCRPKEASRLDGSVPSRVGLGPGSVGRRLGRFVPTLADIYVQMQRMHIYYTIQGKAVSCISCRTHHRADAVVASRVLGYTNIKTHKACRRVPL